jgi:aryl-alcohol dehydrogenase-like predicted oxidoreductase
VQPIPGPIRWNTENWGQTDLNLSLIGFGGAALGGVFGNIDPGEGMRAVHLAVDSGINFFDTSPYYGITLAETRLGEALAGRRERVILATKCGRYGMDEFDFSAKRVIASMDESLRRLQTDYIDLFQVHDVEFGDVQQIIDETSPPCGNCSNKARRATSASRDILQSSCGALPRRRRSTASLPIATTTS